MLDALDALDGWTLDAGRAFSFDFWKGLMLMSKKIVGKSVSIAFKELKSCGFTVTAFIPGWFRAENDHGIAAEYEYDSANYITRFSWC